MTPDWTRLHAEADALAERLLPSLERPSGTWRRRALAYRTALQNYRINRARHRAGRHDLLPLYFVWTVLRSCNFRCTYCDDHQGRKYPDLPAAGALDTEGGRALLRTMRTRTPSVYFAGGEPTARADLPDLSRTARDLGYFPIVVNTNGSLIARNLEKPRWRTWLADTDIVVVSLDALDLDVLARMWAVRDPEVVLRNLLLLRRLSEPLGFRLLVNCVIQPGQVHHAHAVLELCDRLGISFTPVPMNEGPRVSRRLHEDPAYPALVEAILARKRAGQPITGSLRLNRRLLRGEPLDCRNTLKPHVDHDGALIWPCKAAVNVAPAHVPTADFTDVDALYDHACRTISPHGFHGPGPDQCGADCNWAQNYSTDAYVHGLRRPLSLVRDILEFAR